MQHAIKTLRHRSTRPWQDLDVGEKRRTVRSAVFLRNSTHSFVSIFPFSVPPLLVDILRTSVR